MHTTLYRKYRPADFSSVVGQNNITDVLRYEVQNGKTVHAYLFCGSRGTGKTSCAKILAKAINCLSPVDGNPCGKCEACRHIESGAATDIVEMDAASNTGVDDVREIIDGIVYTPYFLKKKVYIIDEVHMLSTSAFNALLKTIEEPPEHIVFIFATTEFQKLPVTIVSRCQRFDFRRISTPDITARLGYIASSEGITAAPDALELIAKLSKGGMRDAISLFELCSGSGKNIDKALVSETLGVPDRKKLETLVKYILTKDIGGILRGIEALTSGVTDVSVFWQDLVSFYREMLICSVSDSTAEYLGLTGEEFLSVRNVARSFTREKLMYHIRLLEDAFISMQKAEQLKRIIAEMTLIKMTDDKLCDDNDALLSRISKLEEGSFVPAEKTSEPVPAEVPEEKPAPAVPDAVPAGDFPLDCWPEIIAKATEYDASAGSFLSDAVAAVKNGNVVVEIGSFGLSMISGDPMIKRIIAKTAVESGEMPSCTADNIKYVEKTKKAKSNSLDLL